MINVPIEVTHHVQIEFLKKLSEQGAGQDKGAISDEKWSKLMADTDPKVSFLEVRGTSHICQRRKRMCVVCVCARARVQSLRRG